MKSWTLYDDIVVYDDTIHITPTNAPPHPYHHSHHPLRLRKLDDFHNNHKQTSNYTTPNASSYCQNDSPTFHCVSTNAFHLATQTSQHTHTHHDTPGLASWPDHHRRATAKVEEHLHKRQIEHSRQFTCDESGSGLPVSQHKRVTNGHTLQPNGD